MAAEADDLMKEATKLSQTSFLSFRFSADWVQATPLFEQAANRFKLARSYQKAMVAYEKAAEGQRAMGSSWHAAKWLEKAADCARELHKPKMMQDLCRQAAEEYKQAGRSQQAAEALARAAQALDAVDSKVSVALYWEALSVLDDGGKSYMADDLYRKAVAGMVAAQQYGDACTALARLAAHCEESGAANRQAGCYLAAVVLGLYAEDAGGAWKAYQDALGVPAFASSHQAAAADALLVAYRTGAPEEVARACARHLSTLLDLDTCVARLAKKLPAGDLQRQAAALQAAAAQFEGGGGGGGEDAEPDLR